MVADSECTEDIEGEAILLMADTDISESKNSKVWYLDSGCSTHMNGNKKWFQ